ncbi:MAG: hypothetical protein E3J35_09200, partial [Methanomassiliicoccales archaeon]
MPRDQQVESTETETSRTRETARLHNLGLKAALCVAFFSVVSAMVLFALFSLPPPPPLEPGGCGTTTAVDFSVTQTPWGYEFEIVFPSRIVAYDCYKVAVLKDGTPWTGFPKIVVDGAIGTGPAGEYLNFTDLT